MGLDFILLLLFLFGCGYVVGRKIATLDLSVVVKKTEAEMMVLKSTFNAMRDRAVLAEAKAKAHLMQWNKLVARINAKGGEDFLENATLSPTPQFTREEIQKLIHLCHPDKHDGKQMAVEITQKLLKLKEK